MGFEMAGAMSAFKLCIRCKLYSTGPCGCDLADMENFAEGLQTRLAAADELLRDLEWIGVAIGESGRQCHSCFKFENTGGHADNCKLKKYLDGGK